MKKREFIKRAGLLAGSAILPLPEISIANQLHQNQKPKVWVWARPETGKTQDYWNRKLEYLKSNGVDAILMEVYNSRKAFFENDRIPVAEKLLEKLMVAGRKTGVEVHAWMWTMPCNIPEIVNNHPDWYAVNRKGESAATHPAYVDYYKFLCPCHPEAREFVRKNVEVLAQFEDLTGVHLDYVRLPDVILAKGLQPKYNLVQDQEFPQFDYCYSDHCRNQFMALTGIDPLKDLADPSAHQAWYQFRFNAITQLVNTILLPEAWERNKMMTAAVFPNWKSVRQEWRNWKLDAFLPMLYHNFYNEGIEWIKKETAEKVEQQVFNRPINSGLFVPSLKPSELEGAINAGLAGGAAGVSFFDLGSLTDQHFEVIRKIRRI